MLERRFTIFSEITQYNDITHFKSFKVIDFGTNRKLICDFLLVINTSVPHILHSFRDIYFDKSKIVTFGYLSCV